MPAYSLSNWPSLAFPNSESGYESSYKKSLQVCKREVDAGPFGVQSCWVVLASVFFRPLEYASQDGFD